MLLINAVQAKRNTPFPALVADRVWMSLLWLMIKSIDPCVYMITSADFVARDTKF